MKFAVIGALGQLGRDLCPRLPGDVSQLTRLQLDLEHPETILPTLERLQPDVVLNCAAYNFVDQAETEPNTAFAVNTWGVGELARSCSTLGCKLVHFSTDYVFGLDTSRRSPFGEDDPPGPLSYYGLSKLAGEYRVRATHKDHLIIRTCGLYGLWGSGGKGGNFVETMLRVAGQGKPLRVVADQFCTPSNTIDVAEATVSLLKLGACGTFHITNGGSCSWYDLAAEIFKLTGVDAHLAAITTAEFAAKAPRPRYSVLSNAKLISRGVTPPREWRLALGSYLEQRQRKGQ